jgi:hypothetical protein
MFRLDAHRLYLTKIYSCEKRIPQSSYWRKGGGTFLAPWCWVAVLEYGENSHSTSEASVTVWILCDYKHEEDCKRWITVKQSRYTPWRRLWGENLQLLSLNLGTGRGWVVTPPFTDAERTPGTHCTGGWVGPRVGLDAEVRGIILWLCLRSNPGRPVSSQTLYWATRLTFF